MIFYPLVVSPSSHQLPWNYRKDRDGWEVFLSFSIQKKDETSVFYFVDDFLSFSSLP
jgi:hypothetical protein